ncbi:zinc finger, CCHC-type containing protein, partial [Tanacetum coccineum]
YGMGSKMTSHGDVYSFGILLLELMTRKKSTDDMFNEGLSIHKFASMALPDHVVDVIDGDASVLQSKEATAKKVEECLAATIKIRVSYSVDSPTQRMKIDIVVNELQSLSSSLYGEVESNCDKERTCLCVYMTDGVLLRETLKDANLYNYRRRVQRRNPSTRLEILRANLRNVVLLLKSTSGKDVVNGEEASHPITKNVNSISLIRGEEEKNVGNNRAIGESLVEPRKSEEEEPLNEVDVMDEVKRRADDKPAKSIRENVTKNEEEEPAGVSSSHTIGYYLEHRINEKLIEGLVENQKFNDSLSATREDIGGNFEIPCNIGGLKHTNALVDQGSNVNIMPLSTYNKLTDVRPIETDIRLSLASQSYIYPLGIAEYVLVDVNGYVYPIDFNHNQTSVNRLVKLHWHGNYWNIKFHNFHKRTSTTMTHKNPILHPYEKRLWQSFSNSKDTFPLTSWKP